jgi:hypothetical protein
MLVFDVGGSGNSEGEVEGEVCPIEVVLELSLVGVKLVVVNA